MSNIAHLATEPTFQTLHTRLDAMLAHVIEEAIAVQQIAAPTFAEGRRAAHVFERFKSIDNLQNVEMDALHNVYARLPGDNPNLPAVLVAAHTDTVFEASTVLDIHHQNGRIFGPGLGDNSLGVASVLTLADLLHDQHLPTDIWFVANVREEGLGNLGGIRAVYDKLAPRLGAALVVEGMAYGHVYHAGIAVRRLEITCKTSGGHSWLHFGKPSAIHTLMRLGADITTLTLPETPRTTYNIGVIKGGQTVNSIASTASLLLDLRSEDREALAAVESQVMAMVERQQQAAPDVEIVVDVVGDRPSGAIPLSHPLVEMARDALQLLNTQPVYEAGSTDANVLLAAGLPTITVGVTNGGNAHRLDEYIETGAILAGLWQLVLLIAGAAEGLSNPLWLPLR